MSAPPHHHPGWVYGVRFTADGKQLVSVGGAPMNKGYLAVWNVADGSLVSGEDIPVGTFYSLSLAPDGKHLVVGTGGNPRTRPQNPPPVTCSRPRACRALMMSAG